MSMAGMAKLAGHGVKKRGNGTAGLAMIRWKEEGAYGLIPSSVFVGVRGRIERRLTPRSCARTRENTIHPTPPAIKRRKIIKTTTPAELDVKFLKYEKAGESVSLEVDEIPHSAIC
jgi:hypothetical protein